MAPGRVAQQLRGLFNGQMSGNGSAEAVRGIGDFIELGRARRHRFLIGIRRPAIKIVAAGFNREQCVRLAMSGGA